MLKSKILIVEDEVNVGMEIAERLNSMGYEVLQIVADGEMAIKAAIIEKPDLILMDIMIRGDIDGIETAQKIKEKVSIPVIYLTESADGSTLERAKVSDAFGYLIKPLEERELNVTIEMALYKHSMELKLREREERFKSLVENSSIGIFRISIQGNILHGNPMFMKLLGYDKMNELVGKNIREFVVRASENTKELIDIIKEKESVNRYIVELIDKNNKTLFVSLGGNVIRWEDEPLYFDGTLEDITKQHQYEEELIEAKERAEESDRLKTEFLAGMSHEIRTPINTIMSYLSLLKTDLNHKENLAYKEIFEAIEVGSLRLTRTIDSILNMAQFQAGTFDIFKTKIDINQEIIKNLYDEFKYTAKQRGLELICINESENTNVLGDKYSLTQLFVNLLDNALKYTKEGQVTIKVYNNEDGILCVDVKDTGIGIGKEFLPTLFKPFRQEEQGYTRKFDGNGLGLALVKKYCSLNDAVIKVSSKKGLGTKFTVKFVNTNENNEIRELQELNEN